MTRRKKITIFAVGIALACGLAACSLLSACEPNSAEGGVTTILHEAKITSIFMSASVKTGHIITGMPNMRQTIL